VRATGSNKRVRVGNSRGGNAIRNQSAVTHVYRSPFPGSSDIAPRSVVAEFNGERIVGRVWPLQQVTVLELTQ